MKKLIYTLFFVLISVVANGQAKYVFYFIGDGMGVNQVNGTEMYQAEIQNGRIGVEPLLFTQFPVATMAGDFLRGDQLDVLLLTVKFVFDAGGDLRVLLLQVLH